VESVALNHTFLSISAPIALFVGVLLHASGSHASDRFEQEPILYGQTPAANVVSALQEALDTKVTRLDYDDIFGYLPSLLDRLDVSHETQVLVFSKTSFQHRYISPETPRAIYYNDEVYVGTVQHGDVLEVSVADEQLGTVFYTLPQRKTEHPRFVRQSDSCLQCHASSLTRGVPGHLVRSVYTDAEGFPILKAGTRITTQDSPMEERWGGWYVTGTHGKARHMGNAIAAETDYDATLDMEPGANLAALPARVNADRYLTPHSDIVSLMVLEHQTMMHNLITNANFETRFALKDQAVMDEILDRDPNVFSESTKRRIANTGNKLVDYMLFKDEVRLTDPVSGTSGFAKAFSSRGPRDKQGRSLRDLNLQTHLFQYPLSYLIYSPQFDALPEPMRDYVYQRLWDVLTNAEARGDYPFLTEETCEAIRQILLDTMPGLPDYWRNQHQ
jgi:hypothetical protein